MVNGAGLTSGSIPESGICCGCRLMGAETGVNNEFAEVVGFSEDDRRGVW